ncbi:MAG: formate dehydrogenase accessory protein FdhE [Candidatus Acidiferrales bacterium]|jgi:FdhE protein
MKVGKWDARIRRAAELASSHEFAAEGLLFYGHIGQFQKSIYARVEAAVGPGKKHRVPGALRQEFDSFVLLPQFAPFLSTVEQHAPAALSQAARDLRAKESGHWKQVLAEFWQDGSFLPEDSRGAEALIAWMFLQPYAEYLADHTVQDPLNGTPPLCPLCGSKPLVGVLRPEGDGGKRSLICSLCASEWEFRRIVCAACGEEDVHKLAVYTAEQFKHVRVEACDACHTYIKTVDLTKNGNAVPVVDELATIPLNLWATEHGYVKLQTNLLGI